MDLHPYDNRERRFRHTDARRDEGIALVTHLLGLPEPPAGDVLFDLSFFSGGIGVVDRLAITLPTSSVDWSQVTEALKARTPEEAMVEEAESKELWPGISWAEELIWLCTLEEQRVPLRPAAIRFINENRREFQVECGSSSRILFGDQSNVNDWAVLWGDDGRLNYLGYSQG